MSDQEKAMSDEEKSVSKRSQSINLNRMRKSFAVNPLALAVTAVTLSACGDNRQEAIVYTNLDDCQDANPEYHEQCIAAYQQALAEAQRTGPKYNNQRDCEHEFGNNQCHRVESSSGSFFMPFMAGYMLSNLFSGSRYYSQPLYTSYSPYSPLRNRWFAGDGQDFGDIGFGRGGKSRKLRVPAKSFDPKPTVNRTIKRGGFGSSVRAKSNWGSSRKSSRSSNRRSWGG